MALDIISLFAGCGGLDLGFRLAGFNPAWANEYDKSIWDTYNFNHSETILDRRDIRKINSDEIPGCVGIIGGPPCQSWSAAGAKRGIDDSRGQLFWEYIRIVRDKQPLFFLAENVSGILAARNKDAFTYILSQFEAIGYRVSFKLLNAKNFGVPQDRQRVIVVGYRQNLGFGFEFPEPGTEVLTLQDAIFDLQAEPILVHGKLDNYHDSVANHECADLGFSSIYMSRNRVRSWGEPSFTIQASGRHAPLHPQASKMILVAKDKRIFDPNSPQPYRRLSVRECARVQTFPDDFIFKYKYIADGYKMVGNAVPVNLARVLASKIYADICSVGAVGRVPALSLL
ncbi:MAG: DNA cytosine methyltransferase [Microcoleus sp. PH2017_22_RUC_O_B]|uniref:DNA cytosine methyltransferase n=1 Tax=unclassified Microcoleus TaxID=2642155 RepID=UPI001D89E40C|nr:MULTISPECIES: DNA cytosine methyltransferase [unclassified Microcoleus]MCC3532376.1 DNA cytosine methyltransferase [Microcoleus sp. PH2017_21_RUC_O_A]MCC3544667.1 DNA cytosine methyltransferase [Microcoleus sp. PH2017_22_RUC_O_B]